MNRSTLSHDPQDAALDALLAQARAERPDTGRAEYGFETRLMARLAEERVGSRDGFSFAGWCWRLLPGLAAVTIVLSWSTWRAVEEPMGNPAAAVTGPLASDSDDEMAQWTAVELFSPI